MARDEFRKDLEALGYNVTDMGEGRIAFRYTVTEGSKASQTIDVGYEVPPDFPLTPPGGPHIKLHMHPLKSGGEHPTGGIHESKAFGPEWQYWSRPMRHWGRTRKSVKDVLQHLDHLFRSQ